MVCPRLEVTAPPLEREGQNHFCQPTGYHEESQSRKRYRAGDESDLENTAKRAPSGPPEDEVGLLCLSGLSARPSGVKNPKQEASGGGWRQCKKGADCLLV
jgi:hypothetical protein